jgi:SAM-dependent methyltransferase
MIHFENDITCPCCGGTQTIGIQDRIGQDGRVHEIAECLYCHAYINRTDLLTALHNVDLLKEQVDSAKAFYSALSAEEIERELAACSNLLKSLLERSSCGRSSILDFGAGRGFLAGAATSHFATVYALEPGIAMLKAVHPCLPNKDRIRMLQSLDELKSEVDAVIMWHVLEHLPRLHADFARIVQFLRPSGSAFFQVPMYGKEHLVESHYVFLNKPSCWSLCEKVGLTPVLIESDTTNNFITCIGRKS